MHQIASFEKLDFRMPCYKSNINQYNHQYNISSILFRGTCTIVYWKKKRIKYATLFRWIPSVINTRLQKSHETEILKNIKKKNNTKKNLKCLEFGMNSVGRIIYYISIATHDGKIFKLPENALKFSCKLRDNWLEEYDHLTWTCCVIHSSPSLSPSPVSAQQDWIFQVCFFNSVNWSCWLISAAVIHPFTSCLFARTNIRTRFKSSCWSILLSSNFDIWSRSRSVLSTTKITKSESAK